MLSLEDAQALVLDELADLWRAECDVGLVIDDADTAEYEWGWVIGFSPDDWSRVPEDHWLRQSFRMSAVDRETGHLQRVGSPGIDAAITQLLLERPPELRTGLIEVRGTTGVVEIRVSDRAFTSVRRPDKRQAEPGRMSPSGDS